MKPLLRCALGLLLLGAAGCSEDFFSSGSTRIEGRVVDFSDTPVAQIRVSPSFFVPVTSARPFSQELSGGGTDTLVVGDPYPNPISRIDDDHPMTLPIQVNVATTISVEVWGVESGVNTQIQLLTQSGAMVGLREVLWDGSDFSGLQVPNGLYTILIRYPASLAGTVVQRKVLVNRSGLGVVDDPTQPFRTSTDALGEYLLTDLPTGEVLQRTDAAGSGLGAFTIPNEVIVFFHDDAGDYLDKTVGINAPPGSSVQHQTVLQNAVLGPEPPQETP